MVESWNMSTRLLMLFLIVGAFVVIWSGDDQHAKQAKFHPDVRHPVHGFLPPQNSPHIRSINVTLNFVNEEVAAGADPLAMDSLERGFGIACLPEAAWQDSQHNGEFANPGRADNYQTQFASFMDEKSWEATPVDADVSTSEHLISMGDCDIPLPVDLSPGEYRIVNTQGAVYWKKWSAGELSYLGIPESVPLLNLYSLEEQGQKWFFVRVEPTELVIPVTEEKMIPVAGLWDRKRELSASPDDSDAAADMIHFAIERIAKSAGRIGERIGSVRSQIQSTIGQTTGTWMEMMRDVVLNRGEFQDGEFQGDGPGMTLPISFTDEMSLAPTRISDRSNQFQCQEFY